jgi:hypothetical protein
VIKWTLGKDPSYLATKNEVLDGGVLSKAENKTISDGLNDVIMDHFVDAVDRNGSTVLPHCI